MTITDVIEMARKVGGYDGFTSPPSDWDEGDFVISPEALLKFATLVLERGALRADVEKVVAWARPVYARPVSAPDTGEWDELVDIEFHTRPEKPEGEGWRPLVVADTGDDTALLPRINVKCETVDNGITGATYLKVIRVEQEDDGSLTAVIGQKPETVECAHEALKAENEALRAEVERLTEALRGWWKAHRPVGWTEDQHRSCPHVNLVTNAEKRLVDAMLRAREVGND